MAPRRSCQLQPSSLLKLPSELLNMIGSQLDYADATCVSLSCHSLHEAFQRPIIPALEIKTPALRTGGSTSWKTRHEVKKVWSRANRYLRSFQDDRGTLLPRLKTWMKKGKGSGQQYCTRCFRYYVPSDSERRKRSCKHCWGKRTYNPLRRAQIRKKALL